MDREVPSVPITTLAGIASVTDLLPEMPIPIPLPQTLSNKSVLFHPRVAEEAQNLLKERDEVLAAQLIQALSQTSADHIELKDNFACAGTSTDPMVDLPQLLQTITSLNPNVFGAEDKSQHTNLYVDYQKIAQRQTGSGIPQHNSHYAPTQAELYADVPMQILQQEQPLQTQHMEQMQQPMMYSDPMSTQMSNYMYDMQVQMPNDNEYHHYQEPQNQALPPTQEHYHQPELQSTLPAPPMQVQHQEQPATSTAQSNVSSCTASMSREAENPNIKQPVVVLQRISDQDQLLMQRSVRTFIQNKPKLAKELGIEDINQANVNNEVQKRGKRANTDVAYVPAGSDSESDGEEAPDKFSELVRKKRNYEQAVKPTPDIVIKPKLRKVEKPTVSTPKKMIEDVMESNTYKRFLKNVDGVLQFYNELELADEDTIVPVEHLINRHVVQELATESAKLNMSGAMEMVPSDKTVKLLIALRTTIRGANNVTLIADEENENLRQLWLETAMERVMGAADASLTCLQILTSRNMPKPVYIEEVIDQIVLYIKYQLNNTIFPSYDVTYRLDNKKTDRRKKKSAQTLHKNIRLLYNKLSELILKLANLMEIQLLTDTTVLHMSSMGIAPFFTDNINELQLSSLKLVTTLFTRYEKHRRLLLDDILASIARLPSSKRNLRTYKLRGEECIQMLTALVLQLIQCIVVLPENLNQKKSISGNSNALKNVDKDLLILNKSDEAVNTAATFLTEFLSKCSTKNEEVDYRPLFENFVQDLLSTVNKPEWPAAEMVLSLLGKVLVTNLYRKKTDIPLRVVSLEYLGVIAARLRRDSVVSRCKLSTIDHMIKEIKAEELRETEGDVSKDKLEVKNDEERTKFLQRVLLDFLAVRGQNHEAFTFARYFYIVQWFRDCTSEKQALSAQLEKTPSKTDVDNHKNGGAYEIRVLEERKKFLLGKVCSFKEAVSAGNRIRVFETYIDYDMAELIVQYLASKQYFSKCFDFYLRAILCALGENSIAIRTKAMRSLTTIVEADPSVLGTRDVQFGVNHCLLDSSTSVREAAVDLVGKFVLSRPELIDKYYQVLSDRILDKGVSVRKRVIKIFKDICLECPEFTKIPDICIRMIRRVNDEEAIRKLVVEVFQRMWFSPAADRILLKKVKNIIEVVTVSSKTQDLKCFEQLLDSLFKPKEDKEDSTKVNTEPPKVLILACKQIVDCLVENVLRIEESTNNEGTSKLLACITTLSLFAKIRPQLLVNHASTLQPYLSGRYDNRDEMGIIQLVARMLEAVLPLMEHPSDSFLSQLELDLMKLILQHQPPIVSSCISCLAVLINKITRNFRLIRDCFTKFFNDVKKFYLHLKSSEVPSKSMQWGYFRRALYTVGVLFRYFNFKNAEVSGNMENTSNEIYEMFMFFLRYQDSSIQLNTMRAMGSVCIRHYEFMLKPELQEFYRRMLLADDTNLPSRIQVLENLEQFLIEEENRMVKKDLEWGKNSKLEDLKEMGDVSSGMASTIIQVYLKEVLQSYLHADARIRETALRVIKLVLQQGLVYPIQIIPHLICMSSDPVKYISTVADMELQDLDKKYPGFIQSQSLAGIRLSFDLLWTMFPSAAVLRGRRIAGEGEYPSALNGFLYMLLRNSKQHRRALLHNMLKQFDLPSPSLTYMLYLADNMAYFPYQVQDEILYIVHSIDQILAHTGCNLLQSFRDGLIQTEAQRMAAEGVQTRPEALAEDDEDEDLDTLISRVPDDVTNLLSVLNSAQGIFLLLVLKQHLKVAYGIGDRKMQMYHPFLMDKTLAKTVARKSNALFEPKATLAKLEEPAQSAECHDVEAKKRLIQQYLDLKEMMWRMDPDDEDDDEDSKKPVIPNPAFNSVATTSLLTEADQVVLSNYKDNPTPKVPKLVISNRRLDGESKRSSRKPPTEKVRKQRQRKRRRISSEEDVSDPEFHC